MTLTTPLAAANQTAEFVLARLRESHGKQIFMGRRAAGSDLGTADDAGGAALPLTPALRVWAERRLRRVPEAAATALLGWARGARPGVLFTTLPTPHEVLSTMAGGKRPVSLLARPDGLEFALHDLCHLEKFWDPCHHEGQVGFFACVKRAFACGTLGRIQAELDPRFEHDLTRVMADMNGSPIFLYCALRASLLHGLRRQAREADFEPTVARLLDAMGVPHGEVRDAALQVRARGSDASALARLEAFFVQAAGAGTAAS